VPKDVNLGFAYDVDVRKSRKGGQEAVWVGIKGERDQSGENAFTDGLGGSFPLQERRGRIIETQEPFVSTKSAEKVRGGKGGVLLKGGRCGGGILAW